MNTEMGNGIQMTLEMWMPEACPRQTVGALEHHVRTSLSQENEQDCGGNEEHYCYAGARFRDQPLYRKNVCKEFCPEKTKETADACDAPGRNLSRTEEHIEPA